MDTREAGIRCETAGKLFCYLIVVIHTFGTCFLVAAHDQADSFVQLHAVVAEKLHGIERFQDRAFVISGPAAVYMIVFTGKAERIVGPVSAYRNDIQMTGDADDLIALTHFGITAVVIQVYGFKAKFFGNLQSLFQGFCRTLTKWFSLGRGTELGVNGNQSAKICEHFF